MSKYSKEIRELLVSQKGKASNEFDLGHYLGTSHELLYISIPSFRKIIKDWAKEHKGISFSEFVGLIDELYDGQSFEERITGPILLTIFSEYKSKLNPNYLEKWLLKAEGWAEIDSLCQSTFNAEDLLSNWSEWKSALTNFSKSNETNLQRASLVLLTKSIRLTDDKRLSALAFQNLNRLILKKEILVTKAVSWVLRSLIKHHRLEVENYLKDNSSRLPKFVVREVTNKLNSGTKSGK